MGGEFDFVPRIKNSPFGGSARRAREGAIVIVPDVRYYAHPRIPAPSCDCVTIHPAMGGELFNSPFGGSARRAREGKKYRN